MARLITSGAAGQAAPDIASQRERIDALAEVPTPELQKIWRQVRGAQQPKGARRRFLMLGIAWQ